MKNIEENFMKFKNFFRKLVSNNPINPQEIEDIFILIINSENRFLNNQLQNIEENELKKHNHRTIIYKMHLLNANLKEIIANNLLKMYEIMSIFASKVKIDFTQNEENHIKNFNQKINLENNYYLNQEQDYKHRAYNLIEEENKFKEENQNFKCKKSKREKQCTYFDSNLAIDYKKGQQQVENFLKEINEDGDISKHYKENLKHEKNRILRKNDNFAEAIGIKKVQDCAIFLDEKIEKIDKMEQIIIALLNSKNSFLIYGVDLYSEKIVGLNMSRAERDIFKINMNKNFSDVLFQYPEYFQYKFYDVEDENNRGSDNLCILVIKINKMKSNSMVFEKKEKKTYVVRKKVLENSKREKNMIQIKDIFELDNKGVIEFGMERLSKYYENKYNLK